jgi:hypothetical protein
MGSASMSPRSPNAVLFTRAQCDERPCGVSPNGEKIVLPRRLWPAEVILGALV